nr:molecular chaperone TorD family protein [Bacillus sp. B15-48]
MADFFEEMKTKDLEALAIREKEAYLATFNVLNETGRIPAPPWESVYTTNDQSMFGDSVYQIRRQLEGFGLEFINKNSEPEDHIAIELEFMMYLNRYTLTALQDENEGNYAKGIYTQYWLHKDHFHRWIHSFTKNIVSANTTSFYKGIAQLLRSFVDEDYEYIKSIKEGLDNE